NFRAEEELKELLGKRSAEDDVVTKTKKIKSDSEKTQETVSRELSSIKEELRMTEELPRIAVHTIETAESCIHEVAVPPEQEFVPLDPPKEPPVRTYPFILDPFQKESILCIDNNQ
ncbi:unnamed protein product, partial [Meganyctiphanes norvegica]